MLSELGDISEKESSLFRSLGGSLVQSCLWKVGFVSTMLRSVLGTRPTSQCELAHQCTKQAERREAPEALGISIHGYCAHRPQRFALSLTFISSLFLWARAQYHVFLSLSSFSLVPRRKGKGGIGGEEETRSGRIHLLERRKGWKEKGRKEREERKRKENSPSASLPWDMNSTSWMHWTSFPRKGFNLLIWFTVFSQRTLFGGLEPCGIGLF